MNQLANPEAFRKILSDYHISDQTKQVLAKTKIALLAAATSSGRNTIIKILQNDHDYYFVVSDTTRKPRINDGIAEQHGKEYWFRNEEEVLERLRKGVYVEAAMIHNQQVSGISIEEIDKARTQNKIAITDIEIAGVETIMKYKKDTIVFFILPPSFEEWMRRLKHRGTMDIEEFKRRLQSACNEFRAALMHDYYIFVVNDSLQHAVAQIHDATSVNKVDLRAQQSGERVCAHLLEAAEDYLQTLK